MVWAPDPATSVSHLHSKPETCVQITRTLEASTFTLASKVARWTPITPCPAPTVLLFQT